VLVVAHARGVDPVLWIRRICGGIVKFARSEQTERMKTNAPSYRGYRFPPDIISHAVWLYHRFCLSFRNGEDLLAERGGHRRLRNHPTVVSEVWY
jgi:hypothetical protein